MRVVYLWKTAAIVCAKIQKRNVSTKITGEATLQTALTPLTPGPCTQMLKVHLWYNDWGVKESVWVSAKYFDTAICGKIMEIIADDGILFFFSFFSPLVYCCLLFLKCNSAHWFYTNCFWNFCKSEFFFSFFFYPCKISLKLLKWQKCTPKICFHKLIITHFWGIPC